MLGDGVDGRLADRTGGPLNDPQRHMQLFCGLAAERAAASPRISPRMDIFGTAPETMNG
jgi:hypothetical protein